MGETPLQDMSLETKNRSTSHSGVQADTLNIHAAAVRRNAKRASSQNKA
jgi:hypothetical protein